MAQALQKEYNVLDEKEEDLFGLSEESGDVWRKMCGFIEKCCLARAISTVCGRARARRARHASRRGSLRPILIYVLVQNATICARTKTVRTIFVLDLCIQIILYTTTHVQMMKSLSSKSGSIVVPRSPCSSPTTNRTYRPRQTALFVKPRIFRQTSPLSSDRPNKSSSFSSSTLYSFCNACAISRLTILSRPNSVPPPTTPAPQTPQAPPRTQSQQKCTASSACSSSADSRPQSTPQTPPSPALKCSSSRRSSSKCAVACRAA